MFRPFSGFKARYKDLTLFVVSEFDDWIVLVYGPDVMIHGKRQFGADKAKAHAVAITESFLREIKNEQIDALPEMEWISTAPEEWLAWRG
ncbi:MAG: hypothetical protein ABFD60_09855 [Bryobacteraceae bacterium]